MTEKDYEKFAEMFGREMYFNQWHKREYPEKAGYSYNDGKRMELAFIIDATIKIFADDNPAFDKTKFRNRIGEVCVRMGEK